MPGEQDYNGKLLKTVGIFSKNRLEWILTDIACWMSSITNIPLYDTLGEDGICWIVEQTKLTTIFLSNDGINRAIELKKKGKVPTLKNLVCFDEISVDLKAKTELNLIPFQDIIKTGKKETGVVLRPGDVDEIMSVCYTSGTTGIPKGVIMRHREFKDTTSSYTNSGVLGSLGAFSTLVSYLPLAHIYERLMCSMSMMSGFRVGFYHGVVSELRDDMVACKPDYLAGVPRVLCRFYDAIMKNINSFTGFKKDFAQAVIKAKLAHCRTTGEVTHWLYDKLLFDNIRASFGGRLKLFLSAAAPMDGIITDHLKIFLCAFYAQGFGQTEATGPLSISYFDDVDSFSVGPPLPRYSIKLVDVPEMDYYTTDVINGVPMPRGEVCVKGPVTQGYFRDPEKTAAMFDSEGWLHTGDIALITPNGCLKAIDRKKNIFKLQQGEYVAPEKIENILVNSPWIQQLLVHGNSYQNYIVALVIPQEHVVMNWAKQNGIKGSFEDICETEALNKAILRDLINLSRDKKLVGFEVVKKIHVQAKPLTLESGALTPTLKVKRHVVSRMFEDAFNRLYAQPLTSE